MAVDSFARSLGIMAMNYQQEHAAGNYNDIANKPSLNGKTILGARNSAYYNLPLLNETANKIALSMTSEDYILTAKLFNKDGQVISESILDMPLEELVVDGRYEEDSEGKGWLVLVLRNGHEIRVPLDELIDELATIEYVDFQDDYLESLIDSEKAVRKAKDDELLLLINSETSERIAKDAELLVLLNSETSERMAADALLRADLDSEGLIRKAEDDRLDARIDSETSERMAADALLRADLDSEALIRQAEDDELTLLLNSEAEARIEGDSELLVLINSEAQTRAEQDALLLEYYDSEKAARISADDLLRRDLTSEGMFREAEDTRLAGLINNEATIRYNADQALGARMDSLPAVDDITVKKDNQNRLFVPIDYNTISVNPSGQLVAVGGSSAVQSYLNGELLDSEATSISAKIFWTGTQAEYDLLDSEAKADPNTLFLVDSSEGRPITWTKSYTELQDKPQIAGVTLDGDKSLASFGIQPTLTGTNPISVAGNQVSLRYNENQFFIGADNKLSFNDKDPSFDVSHMITFRAGFVGILGGMNCVKFNNGLYVGQLKFMNENALSAGDITVGAAFGDGGQSFEGYCFGFDETNHVPICFQAIDGELHMYATSSIPARQYITVPFTFVL